MIIGIEFFFLNEENYSSGVFKKMYGDINFVITFIINIEINQWNLRIKCITTVKWEHKCQRIEYKSLRKLSLIPCVIMFFLLFILLLVPSNNS